SGGADSVGWKAEPPRSSIGGRRDALSATPRSRCPRSFVPTEDRGTPAKRLRTKSPDILRGDPALRYRVCGRTSNLGFQPVQETPSIHVNSALIRAIPAQKPLITGGRHDGNDTTQRAHGRRRRAGNRRPAFVDVAEPCRSAACGKAGAWLLPLQGRRLRAHPNRRRLVHRAV